LLKIFQIPQYKYNLLSKCSNKKGQNSIITLYLVWQPGKDLSR
jgi:hypothetical protein